MPGNHRGNNKPTGPRSLSGVQKAAILMLALGQQTAARILKKLPREYVEQIGRAIADIDRVDPEIREQTIREFCELMLARRSTEVGGLALARSLLEKTLPPHEVQRVIAPLERRGRERSFSFMQQADTESILTFLKPEHPQTVALVLSHMPPETASAVLTGLEPERQIEVVMRIANMEQASPEAVWEVEHVLEQRLAGVVSQRAERAGGVRAVVEMLNVAGREAEKAVLEGLSEDNPDLVEEISRLMFAFEDILRVDDRGIQAVLKEIEKEELALALRTASDKVKEKIFANMSERAAQLIKEEMEYMGPVRLSEVEAAQQKIADTLRKLEDAGEIIISGKGGDKDLIV